jgi:hypothetical protein
MCLEPSNEQDDDDNVLAITAVNPLYGSRADEPTREGWYGRRGRSLSGGETLTTYSRRQGRGRMVESVVFFQVCASRLASVRLNSQVFSYFLLFRYPEIYSASLFSTSRACRIFGVVDRW